MPFSDDIQPLTWRKKTTQNKGGFLQYPYFTCGIRVFSDVSVASLYTEKDEPQPHVVVAFGLRITN